MRDLTLPSRSASVREATDAAEQAAEALGWSTTDVNRVALAVSEAVANAVEHGPGAPIHVTIEPLAEGAIRVCVSDDGPGPTGRDLADARLPDDLLSQGGRGLYIIRTLVDDLNVEAGEVRLLLRPHDG